jgi:hypothetical protein
MQQTTIEENTKTVEVVERKKTSFDMLKDAGAIKFEMQKLLVEEPDNFEELFNELQARLIETEDSLEGKVQSMRWVKDKINEQVVASKAVKDMYKSQSDSFRDTENARKNDLERLKDRVILIVKALPEGKVKVDGKNIIVTESITGTITDEVQAYDTLSEHGLASVHYNIGGEHLRKLRATLCSVLGQASDEETGEPIAFDPVPMIQACLNLSSELSEVLPNYSFATGGEVNKFVRARVLERREIRTELIEEFDGLDPEDMEDEEQDKFFAELKHRLEHLPLTGIDVTVKDGLRGF